jgi:signal transduction histidine kinase
MSYKSPVDGSDHFWEQIAIDQRSLHHRNNELQILTAITRALNRAFSLNEMSDTVLEQTSGLLTYEQGFIVLIDEETGAPQVLAQRGYAPRELDDSICFEQNKVTPQNVNIPLYAFDKIIGVLHIEALPTDQGTWRSLHLLANILATAVEKHRLLEAAQREVRAQTLLNEAGRVLTSTLDEQEVLTLIMREVIQSLNAEAGSVVLVDEERGDMVFAAAASPYADRLVGMLMPLGRGIVGWTIQNRQSVLTADAHTDPRHYYQVDQETGFQTKSVICVPLLSKDRVTGAIEVMNSKNGQFSQYDLRLLESLAPQAAIAIENAFLFESVKAQMLKIEQTQDQLLQAEKLSAIGQLVAGVAHELNNPLTAIVGYAQLLLETCEDQEVCEDLERINREAQRSARIVQNLLAFARQQKMEKHPVELGGILNKTIDLLAYQLEVDNIKLIRNIPSEPMIVLGDTYQLQQVFLNVITNAHQEMRKAHGAGTLTIGTRVIEQHTVQVQFIDDGPGISKENIGRIFDPFFTTKDVGEGTGLGLSICLGIVQEHEGRIWADSELGQGATFSVELPLYKDTLQDNMSMDIHVKLTSIEQLDVLVVDDEIEIARLFQRILESEGHSVTAVHSGLEAREVINSQHFNLIICDLKMPGMNGRELYAYLKQTNPELARHVIFSTGDVVSDESWTFLEEVGNRFISKPFKPEQVLAGIREILTN